MRDRERETEGSREREERDWRQTERGRERGTGNSELKAEKHPQGTQSLAGRLTGHQRATCSGSQGLHCGGEGRGVPPVAWVGGFR